MPLLLPSQRLATTHVFLLTWPFLEWHINLIIQCIVFCIWQLLLSLMLLQCVDVVAFIRYLLLLGRISWYECTIICLQFIQQLMDTWAVNCVQWLWIKLLWTFVWSFCVDKMSALPLGKYLGGRLLTCMVKLKQFPRAAVLFCIAREFQLLHTFSTWYSQSCGSRISLISLIPRWSSLPGLLLHGQPHAYFPVVGQWYMFGSSNRYCPGWRHISSVELNMLMDTRRSLIMVLTWLSLDFK